MALLTSTSDIGLFYSVDPITHQLTVDFRLTPSSDLLLVTGVERVKQDVLRWLLTPQGSTLDPDYGNPFLTLWRSPMEADVSLYEAMIEQAEADFIARQSHAAAQGFIDDTSLIDRFDDTHVDLAVPGLVVVSFTVVTRSGDAARTVAPFSLTVGA